MLRDLSWGCNGLDVLAVQQGLNQQRWPEDDFVDEIGVFGPATDAAVRRFQERNRLTVDGIVGPATRAKLFPLATVTVQLVGMRLRMPNFDPPPYSPDAFSMPSLVPASPPGPGQLTMPGLGPLNPYSPLPYPQLPTPIATPPLTPALIPGLSLPVDHFEISPGSTFQLGRKFDLNFSLTISAVIMIGDEHATHNEFSSGLLTQTPGVIGGGDWTVGWFAQLTHVQQLGRVGNLSWQPNGQVSAGNTGFAPGLTVGASPAVVQWDANQSLSISFGGPSVSATFSPGGSTLGWGLGSFGIIGKF